jgi:hypothetical protein
VDRSKSSLSQLTKGSVTSSRPRGYAERKACSALVSAQAAYNTRKPGGADGLGERGVGLSSRQLVIVIWSVE